MGSSSGAEKENENPYNNSNIKRAKLNSTLAALIDDPILSDVPIKPSLSDVDTLIQLELGSAMRISVLKMDGSSIDVPVMNTATVKELKMGIKKKVNECEQFKMGHRHISWNVANVKEVNKTVRRVLTTRRDALNLRIVPICRGLKVFAAASFCAGKHVWGNFCLSYHNEKLLDDDVGLQDYGIRNNSQVHFIPSVMSRASRRHSRRKKHRFFHGLNKRFTAQ